MNPNLRVLLNQRLNRIKQAVALETPDRVPVVLEFSGFAPLITQTSVHEFLATSEKSLETMQKAFQMVGAGDAINYGSFWVYGLCTDYFAKVHVPGIELADNDLWQVVESELMKKDDYDQILDMGWPDFAAAFMEQRIFNDVPARLLPPQWESKEVLQKWADQGIPVLSGGDVTTPFEVLCGSRSLVHFFTDLVEIPDKIETVMDAIIPHLSGPTIDSAVRQGYPGVWIGGWRSAPMMISPAMWNRFVWPYMKQLVEEVVAAGLIAILHLDSNWTRELKRFRELPEGKCIMALDGETDIFKAKQLLGDHICIMGDVPASLLCFSSAEEVSRYCKNLIRELGPGGYILQSGCDIPANARLENVKAMVAAAMDSG
ncbi:MAG: uroporphyrinogen decarboxylase family protein [bacterium]